MNYIKTSEILKQNGQNIALYSWLPASGEPRAIVQLSHGMCEYAERYEHLADFLCSRGIALIGHDHPGHGHSAASPDELGFIAEKDGAAVLVAVLRTVNLLIRERFPETPLFLLGHSMGSFIARDYITRWGSELTGAIICGTAGPNPAASAGIFMANALIRIKGSHHRSRFLYSISTGAYGKAFPDDPAGKNAWISRDAALTARYADDPFCKYIFTAAGYRDLFTLLNNVSAPEWASSVPTDLPLYIISGEKDPVGNFGKGVRIVADRLEKAGVRDMTLRLYSADRHEIFNELDKETVFAELAAWLESKLA